MRFLVDNNLSPRLAERLVLSGHDAVHVSSKGMGSASDVDILEWARQENRILISADTDFSTILSEQRAAKPSIILWRRSGGRRIEELASTIEANLTAVGGDLDAGAVVVFTGDFVRIRRLPLLPA